MEGAARLGCDAIFGTTSPRINETHAATKDTPVACTWSSERLPNMIVSLASGSSSSPTFAAVPSRADKFISRFPFKFKMTGMIITSSSMVLIAFQRAIWSNNSPVNSKPAVVNRRVGAL